jgi:damage-control phosphatase, subfamily I
MTLAIRRGPILTDVTLREIKNFERYKKVDTVTTTDSNVNGLPIEKTPTDLIIVMKNATLIVIKRMANYGILSENNYGPVVVYMFLAKCECIAEDLRLKHNLVIAKLLNYH